VAVDLGVDRRAGGLDDGLRPGARRDQHVDVMKLEAVAAVH
jgi:hypothetical protein